MSSKNVLKFINDKQIEFVDSEVLSVTERGTGGHGSTGTI